MSQEGISRKAVTQADLTGVGHSSRHKPASIFTQTHTRINTDTHHHEPYYQQITQHLIPLSLLNNTVLQQTHTVQMSV